MVVGKLNTKFVHKMADALQCFGKEARKVWVSEFRMRHVLLFTSYPDHVMENFKFVNFATFWHVFGNFLRQGAGYKRPITIQHGCHYAIQNRTQHTEESRICLFTSPSRTSFTILV